MLNQANNTTSVSQSFRGADWTLNRSEDSSLRLSISRQVEGRSSPVSMDFILDSSKLNELNLVGANLSETLDKVHRYLHYAAAGIRKNGDLAKVIVEKMSTIGVLDGAEAVYSTLSFTPALRAAMPKSIDEINARLAAERNVQVSPAVEITPAPVASTNTATVIAEKISETVSATAAQQVELLSAAPAVSTVASASIPTLSPQLDSPRLGLFERLGRVVDLVQSSLSEKLASAYRGSLLETAIIAVQRHPALASAVAFIGGASFLVAASQPDAHAAGTQSSNSNNGNSPTTAQVATSNTSANIVASVVGQAPGGGLILSTKIVPRPPTPPANEVVAQPQVTQVSAPVTPPPVAAPVIKDPAPQLAANTPPTPPSKPNNSAPVYSSTAATSAPSTHAASDSNWSADLNLSVAAGIDVDSGKVGAVAYGDANLKRMFEKSDWLLDLNLGAAATYNQNSEDCTRSVFGCNTEDPRQHTTDYNFDGHGHKTFSSFVGVGDTSLFVERKLSPSLTLGLGGGVVGEMDHDGTHLRGAFGPKLEYKHHNAQGEENFTTDFRALFNDEQVYLRGEVLGRLGKVGGHAVYARGFGGAVSHFNSSGSTFVAGSALGINLDKKGHASLELGFAASQARGHLPELNDSDFHFPRDTVIIRDLGTRCEEHKLNKMVTVGLRVKF